MIINVDSDGVVYDWHGFMIPYLSDRLGVEVTRESFDNWDLAANLGIPKKEFYKHFDAAVNAGAFLLGAPIEGAIDALHSLIDTGHRVRIVTNKILKGNKKASVAMRSCISFYEQHDLADQVEFVLTGSRFGKTAYTADLVIDDKPDLSWVQPYPTVNALFDQPWNRSTLKHLARINEDPNFDNPEIYRAEGWLEVLELVEQMGGGILVDKSPTVV